MPTSATTLDRPRSTPAYAPRVSFGRVAWLPWTDPGPIATTTGERAFVAELAARCGEPADSHGRSDATAVLNALRGGLTVDGLLANAPGVRLDRLYSAYLDLDGRRERAVAAWNAIVASPDVETLVANGDQAARLVPVLVQRLLETADIDGELLPRVVANLGADVQEVRQLIHTVERELDVRVGGEMATAISRTLYDPTADCIFARVEHLPERVGSLVPTRVAALLNEHVQGLSLVAGA